MIDASRTTVSVRNTETSKVVSVRTLDRGIVDRVIWQETDSHVYVCTETSYRMLCRGLDAPAPIGFPWSDVVRCG